MDKMKSSVTIADVARMAGVSKTTVSRFLNGKYEFMSNESKNRIQSIIEGLNYRPNNLARSLKSSKSGLIGVIIADIGSPISSILVKSINDHCNSYGYNVLIANTDNSTQKEQDYILSMLDQRVEGLIVHTTGENNDFLLEVSQTVPIVLADRPTFPTLFDTVKTSDYQSTTGMVSYLAQEGFKRVGYFTEPVGQIGTRIIRMQACNQACNEMLGVDAQSYVIDAANIPAVEQRVSDFVTSYTGEAKVIFCANGVVLLSVISAIDNLKLHIPGDLGVCGFDDWPWAALVGPGITAIAQPSSEVGVECAKRILYRIRNTKAPLAVVELPNQLMIRGSTKLAGQDRKAMP
jgi:LacI family kdg operon repressor